MNTSRYNYTYIHMQPHAFYMCVFSCKHICTPTISSSLILRWVKAIVIGKQSEPNSPSIGNMPTSPSWGIPHLCNNYTAGYTKGWAPAHWQTGIGNPGETVLTVTYLEQMHALELRFSQKFLTLPNIFPTSLGTNYPSNVPWTIDQWGDGGEQRCGKTPWLVVGYGCLW